MTNQSKLSGLHCTTYNKDTGMLVLRESYIHHSVRRFAESMGVESNEDIFRNTSSGRDHAEIAAEFMVKQYLNYASFVAETGLISDSDVSQFLRDLGEVVDWNSVEALKTQQYFTKAEFFLYCMELARNKTLAKDAEGNIVQVIRARMERSMFGTYVSTRVRRAIIIGEDVNWIYSDVNVIANKIQTSVLPLIEASSEDIKTKTEFGTSYIKSYQPVSFLNYSGVAYFPGFMGMPTEVYLSNSRVIRDAQALKLENYSMMRSLLGMFGGEVEDDESMELSDVLETLDDCKEVTATISTDAVIFDLERKRWYLGSHENLSEVNLRKDALSKLILDENKKEMIKAIASNHRVENTDIIDGKGSNAIFLLYGDPGTGKTLTAEAVAEFMSKPLYKVSLGELGTDVSDLEDELQRILNLCERWDCIMLIDEADIFLERRDTSNLERNAMVAVFLRMLEYYEGILFLTTNRVKQFDTAFVSRISLAIHYERPDMPSLWNMLLTHSKVDYTDADVVELAEYGINGRQAKMAINTAKAVAAYNEVEVTTAHIRASLEETKTFQKYLDQ